MSVLREPAQTIPFASPEGWLCPAGGHKWRFRTCECCYLALSGRGSPDMHMPVLTRGPLHVVPYVCSPTTYLAPEKDSKFTAPVLTARSADHKDQ